MNSYVKFEIRVTVKFSLVFAYPFISGSECSACAIRIVDQLAVTYICVGCKDEFFEHKVRTMTKKSQEITYG